MANPPSPEHEGGGAAMSQATMRSGAPGKNLLRRGRWLAGILAVSLVAMQAGLVGEAVAGASTPPAPPTQVLVRVSPGTESSVALGLRALGADPHGQLKGIDGFLATVPADKVDAVGSIPGVLSAVTGLDVAFDPAFYAPEKTASSL